MSTLPISNPNVLAAVNPGLADVLKRLGVMQRDTVSAPQDIQLPPSQTVSQAPVNLDQELSQPMPQFEYKPQQQVGGIRGLLAMLASGIGHGAGANSVGEGIERSFGGLQNDAERRRQFDYHRQGQQFKNAYDAEADRRANLVRIVQQQRLQKEADARRAHEAQMAGIATDRAGFDMAQAGQKLIEDENNRKALDARDSANRASREKIAGLLAGSREKIAAGRNATLRATASQRAGSKGDITPKDALRNVQQLEDDLRNVTSQIQKHKTARFMQKGKNQGKLMNPGDAQGNHPEINALWNAKKKLEQDIAGWRNWLARGGVGEVPAVLPEQQQPQQEDPILSLFSDLLND
jgi:hypothetical protein